MGHNDKNNVTTLVAMTTLASLPLLHSPTYAESSRVLEEVIVTAQKREQGLIDIPASISVIGAELSEEAALIDAEDMVAYTPNVKLNTDNVNPVLSIRGFGTPPLARNIEPSVGVIINEIYYGRVTFVNDGVFDMERLEVLRGPQGILFGKNTVSGVLNFTTRTASPETQGYINLAAGSLNEQRIEGGISFPLISDRIGTRIAFRSRESDIGVHNTKLNRDIEQKDVSFRISSSIELSDRQALSFEYFQTDAETNGYGIQAQATTERAREVYLRHDPRFEDDVYDGNESTDVDAYSERHSKSLTLKYQHSWEDLGVISNLDMNLVANRAEIRSPFLSDTDFSPVKFSALGSDGPEGYEQESLELRFSGDLDFPSIPGEGLEFTAGLFGFKSEAAATQLSVIHYEGLEDMVEAGQGGLPAVVAPIIAPAAIAADRLAAGDPTKSSAITRNISALNNDSASIFTQMTWLLSDRVDLTVGARYVEEKKQGFVGSQSDSQVVAKQFGGQVDFYEDYESTEYSFSPKLALSWELNPDVRLFAIASKGTKGGGVSGPLISPIDTTYTEEQAVSTELGVKSYLFDKTLQLNMTIYHVAYEDLQVQAFNGVQFTTLNAAEATGKGFELDFQWLPSWQALTVAGSIGISETAYDDYPCAPGTAEQSTDDNPAGCDTAIPRQDLSGKEVPYAPKVSASLYPSLRFPLSDNWGMLLGLDILYQGEHYLDIDLDEQARQEATTQFNARIGMRQIDGGWSAVLNAKNISSEQERSLFLDSPRNVGNYVARAKHSEPTYSLDIRYSFD